MLCLAVDVVSVMLRRNILEIPRFGFGPWWRDTWVLSCILLSRVVATGSTDNRGLSSGDAASPSAGAVGGR